MCLTSVWSESRVEVLRKRGPIKAWKVVYRGGVRLKAIYGPYTFRTGYRILTDKSHARISYRYGKTYEAGFHVFATCKSAMKYAGNNNQYLVIPCLVWDIVAAGWQNTGPVYVAKKMMLLV